MAWLQDVSHVLKGAPHGAARAGIGPAERPGRVHAARTHPEDLGELPERTGMAIHRNLHALHAIKGLKRAVPGAPQLLAQALQPCEVLVGPPGP